MPKSKQHPGLITISRGRLLYQQNIDAYAHRHNISRGATIHSPEFRAYHSLFRKELQLADRWRKQFIKTHNRLPRKNEVSPHNETLNQLAKDLGKKARYDFSDFGSTPDIT